MTRIKGAVNITINRPLINPDLTVARPFNPDLTKKWKISLPAPLAGRVELSLWDTINKKPAYGKRGELIEALLNEWLAGRVPNIPIQPTPPDIA